MPRTGSTSTASRNPSRAERLIEQILAGGAVSASDLAAALVVSERRLETFRSGDEAIPFDRQLCLALFAIEHVPGARRAGLTLRAQVRAEIAMATEVTERHSGPPVSHRWR